MALPTTTAVPAPRSERPVRRDLEAAREAPARAEPGPGPQPVPPQPVTPQPVLLAGEDEDACRAEPHIWRGID